MAYQYICCVQQTDETNILLLTFNCRSRCDWFSCLGDTLIRTLRSLPMLAAALLPLTFREHSNTQLIQWKAFIWTCIRVLKHIKNTIKHEHTIHCAYKHNHKPEHFQHPNVSLHHCHFHHWRTTRLMLCYVVRLQFKSVTYITVLII